MSIFISVCAAGAPSDIFWESDIFIMYYDITFSPWGQDDKKRVGKNLKKLKKQTALLTPKRARHLC